LIGNVKAEKYVIVTDAEGGQSSMRIRFGFGAAGEEVQKLLESAGTERVRVRIDGAQTEVVFLPGKPQRLVDIKQRIKSLSFDDWD
jgi:hypothetical protein